MVAPLHLPVRSPRRSTRACLLALAFVAVAIPASARAQGPVKPFQELSLSASTMRDSLVSLARAQLGKRYVFGGTNPEKGFDCSGLVKYIMATFQKDLPRTARMQARTGLALATDTSRLRPGDLLTFGKKTSASHIGIYVGNGRFIHASSVAGRVIESPVNRPKSRLIKVWSGARRILALDDSIPFATDTVSAVASPLTPKTRS